MATLKLKTKPRPGSALSRPPLRGAGSAPRHRPTLAEAQTERRERQGFVGKHPSEAPQGRGGRAVEQPVAPRPRSQPGNAPLLHPHPQGAARAAKATGPRLDVPRSNTRPQPPLPPPASTRSAPRTPRAEARPETPAPRPHEGTPDNSLRLSKRMSQLGLASRREADEWIAKGYVRVDGRIVNELGSRVLPEQQVTIDARARQLQAQKVTILINKPVGFVSGQAEDGHQPAVTLFEPRNQWRDDRSGFAWTRDHLRGLAPAGRLDIDSVGLLVLTQDGRIARQLIGDDSSVEKEYRVRVRPVPGREPLDDTGLALLRHGLKLDGEPLREAEVEWIDNEQLRFVLRQGKKRQIRRMCEAVGLEVLRLERVRIGHVALGELPLGRWRYLGTAESFE